MILNRRGEYSILGMLHLVNQDNGTFVEIHEVASSVGVPEKFLRILFHELVKSRLLRSQRGTGGGFALARSAEEITLRQIIEAIQGPIAMFDCAAGREADCEKSACCGLHHILTGIRNQVVGELDRHTLADLSRLQIEDLAELELPEPSPTPVEEPETKQNVTT
jgi:Rrf2 family protein